MSSSSGDPRESQPLTENGQPELELETGPRAERPNFLTATRFVDFDLPPEILEGLDNAGFEYCTPIQAQAIPVAMSGLDIAGQAQTGTGKTTAFLVPLLNRLLKNKPLEADVPRAIIVTPTRELALQIYEDALTLAGATSLKQVLVIGGIDYKEQADLLAAGPEIVICTPGRIIDYLQQGIFKTKGIETAVVDEADRLLDMGFIKDLKYLLGKLPPFTHRQTMLFSATLDERVLELTYEFMNPPQFITAEPDKATKIHIEQELYHVGRDEKLCLLIGLLRREEHRRVIIFANTKSGVEWLARKLTLNGFQAEGITGDLPQPKRLKLMEAFKENRLQILAATDVASRGIHVDDVSHVYNYDLPQDAENYVHRIGRTARAGHAGKAVSFGCEDYVFHLEAIENLLGEKIPVFWAEQEWFQDDQGGDVYVKDRRGDRDRDRRKGSGRGGREGGAGGRALRGPARSQRLGGIFGLSPRCADGGLPDVRQTLNWTVDLAEEPVLEGEIIDVSGEPADASDREARPERERRRKRRRGRRGRDASSETAAGQAAASEAPAEEAAGSEASDRPVDARASAEDEAVPAAETGADMKKAAAKKGRRSSRKPKVEPAAPTAEPAAPVALEEAGGIQAATSASPPAEPGPTPPQAPASSGEPRPAAEPGGTPPAAGGRKKAAASAGKPRGVARKAVEEAPDPGRIGMGDVPAAAKAKAAPAPRSAAAGADESPAPVKKTPAKKVSAKKTAASKSPAPAESAAESPAGDDAAPPKAAARPRRASAKKTDDGAGEPPKKPAAKKTSAPRAAAKKAPSPTRTKGADGRPTGSEKE